MNRVLDSVVQPHRLAGLRRSSLFSTMMMTLGAWASLTGIARAEAPASGQAANQASTRETDVESLLLRLRNPSAARRREALLRLADTSVDPQTALVHIWPLLQDADPIVRAQAARAVWRIGKRADAAVVVLNGLLDPEQPQVCALASFLIGEIGPAARGALPALRARMTETDPLLRLHAAEAIARIDPNDAAAHTALFLALHDKSSDVRYFAACALLTVGDRYRDQARAVLLDALADDDLRVASAAALSLESYQPAPTVAPVNPPLVPSPELSRLMGNLTDTSVAVRRRAALRIAEMGESANPAVRTLRQRLNDDDPVVRAYAAYALWQVNQQSTAVIPTLIDLLGTVRPNVTTLATAVLARIGPPAADALPALYDLLDSGEPLVRLHVAIAISRIDSRERNAVGILAASARHDDSDLRYLATLSLGHVSLLSRKRAERELTTALADRNLRVRAAAALALDNLHAAAARARIVVEEEVETLPTEQVAEPVAEIAAVPRTVEAEARPSERDVEQVAERIAEQVAERVAQKVAERAAEQVAERVSERVSGEVSERYVEQAAMRRPSGNIIRPGESLADQRPTAPVGREVPADYDDEGDDTAAIPVLDEKPLPQPRANPDITNRTYDIDEETEEERRSIGQLRARITPSEGDLPIDHAKPRFAQEPVYAHGYGTVRGWNNSSFSWESTSLCYQPLYFQDVNLERYGYHYGCAQTLVSTVKFAADTALLPYKVVAYPYCDCYYTLGYDRPGNCVPYRFYRLPWRTDAAAVLTGVGVGLFFLAP